MAIYDIPYQIQVGLVKNGSAVTPRQYVSVYSNGDIAATPKRPIELAVEYANRGFDVVKLELLAYHRSTVYYVTILLNLFIRTSSPSTPSKGAPGRPGQ
jgi:hypothetical protein